MRAGCVIALVGCLASLGANVEQEFPYAAYIARDVSAVRSGPGRNYYATDKLSLGEMVVVYKHQDDWCAIRPPEGSFSWVKADDLRIGREGIGIVLVEGAASRIGSRTSNLRDVIQVRLERGEEVEVLDAVQVSNDNGVEFYCKIAPPSGEFRWIHKDDLSREKPEHDPAQAAGENRLVAAPEANDRPPDSPHDKPSDRWGSWIRSRRQTDGAAGESLDDNHSRSRSAISLASADDDGQTKGRADRSQIAYQRDSDALAAEVESIDRELSRIVVSEPSQWHLVDVRHRTDLAMQNNPPPELGEKIRDLQDRITRFEDIHRRSLNTASPRPFAPSPATARAVLSSANHTAAIDPTRFDGTGKLTRVVSQRPNAPQYALVNNANEVVSFVSAAPGVNLQSFEGQLVGLSGQRGYMPELKKPHITALRVSPLGLDQTRIARRR